MTQQTPQVIDGQSEPVVRVGKFSRRSFPRRPQKKVTLVIAGLALLTIVTGVFIWNNGTDNEKSQSEDPPYVKTDKEFAKVQAASLRKTKPVQNASVETKQTYYDELIASEVTAGNYKEATAVYGEAVAALQKSNLGFNTYIAAAKSYAALGDKSQAESILVLAEQTVKKSTPDETRRGDLLAAIAFAREEIRK